MVGPDKVGVQGITCRAGHEIAIHVQVLAPKLFLNTFGGNPVCCAGGRAVLRIIDDEGIQANCAKVMRNFQADRCPHYAWHLTPSMTCRQTSLQCPHWQRTTPSQPFDARSCLEFQPALSP